MLQVDHDIVTHAELQRVACCVLGVTGRVLHKLCSVSVKEAPTFVMPNRARKCVTINGVTPSIGEWTQE